METNKYDEILDNETFIYIKNFLEKYSKQGNKYNKELEKKEQELLEKQKHLEQQIIDGKIYYYYPEFNSWIIKSENEKNVKCIINNIYSEIIDEIYTIYKIKAKYLYRYYKYLEKIKRKIK